MLLALTGDDPPPIPLLPSAFVGAPRPDRPPGIPDFQPHLDSSVLAAAELDPISIQGISWGWDYRSDWDSVAKGKGSDLNATSLPLQPLPACLNNFCQLLAVVSVLVIYGFQGAEYDVVKALKSSRVGFRDEIWIHVNFLARRRGAPPDAPEQRFFAEIHYDRVETPFVETCTILENPLHRFKKECSFCDGSYGILHPSDGEFVCGKKRQKKEFFRTRNVYECRFGSLPLHS